MESNSSQSGGYAPKLKSFHEFSIWKPLMFGYLAQHNLSEILRPNWAIPGPPRNGAVDLRSQAISKDERVYGHLIASMSDFPILLNKVLALPTLNHMKPDFVASGSTLLKAMEKVIMENPSEAFYTSVETQISAFSQGSKPIPKFISELDNLFSQLPERLAYSDAKKMFTLRRGLHADYKAYSDALAATMGITYTNMCESLMGEYNHKEAILSLQAASNTEITKNMIHHQNESSESANFAKRGFKHTRDSRPKSVDKKRHEGKCFTCGKSGHFSNQCWHNNGNGNGKRKSNYETTPSTVSKVGRSNQFKRDRTVVYKK